MGLAELSGFVSPDVPNCVVPNRSLPTFERLGLLPAPADCVSLPTVAAGAEGLRSLAVVAVFAGDDVAVLNFTCSEVVDGAAASDEDPAGIFVSCGSC